MCAPRSFPQCMRCDVRSRSRSRCHGQWRVDARATLDAWRSTGPYCPRRSVLSHTTAAQSAWAVHRHAKRARVTSAEQQTRVGAPKQRHTCGHTPGPCYPHRTAAIEPLTHPSLATATLCVGRRHAHTTHPSPTPHTAQAPHAERFMQSCERASPVLCRPRGPCSGCACSAREPRVQMDGPRTTCCSATSLENATLRMG